MHINLLALGHLQIVLIVSVARVSHLQVENLVSVMRILILKRIVHTILHGASLYSQAYIKQGGAIAQA